MNFKIRFMKKASIVLITILLQSCYSYQSVPFDNIESGKSYVVKLKKGKNEIPFKAKEKLSNDTLHLLIKGKLHSIPKTEIAYLKKRKVSIWKVGVGVVMGAAAIIWAVDQINEETPGERRIP